MNDFWPGDTVKCIKDLIWCGEKYETGKEYLVKDSNYSIFYINDHAFIKVKVQYIIWSPTITIPELSKIYHNKAQVMIECGNLAYKYPENKFYFLTLGEYCIAKEVINHELCWRNK